MGLPRLSGADYELIARYVSIQRKLGLYTDDINSMPDEHMPGSNRNRLINPRKSGFVPQLSGDGPVVVKRGSQPEWDAHVQRLDEILRVRLHFDFARR
jgi:hypothetical protein